MLYSSRQPANQCLKKMQGLSLRNVFFFIISNIWVVVFENNDIKFEVPKSLLNQIKGP